MLRHVWLRRRFSPPTRVRLRLALAIRPCVPASRHRGSASPQFATVGTQTPEKVISTHVSTAPLRRRVVASRIEEYVCCVIEPPRAQEGAPVQGASSRPDPSATFADVERAIGEFVLRVDNGVHERLLTKNRDTRSAAAAHAKRQRRAPTARAPPDNAHAHAHAKAARCPGWSCADRCSGAATWPSRPDAAAAGGVLELGRAAGRVSRDRLVVDGGSPRREAGPRAPIGLRVGAHGGRLVCCAARTRAPRRAVARCGSCTSLVERLAPRRRVRTFGAARQLAAGSPWPSASSCSMSS